MIPKIIHYCWFGGAELPTLERSCIATWKKVMPDYEIRRWDESNFKFEDCKFAEDAYRDGKMAFVSDYAHCKVLSEYGGIALDTDVELLKSLDEFQNLKTYLGFGKNGCYVNPGLVFASEPNACLLTELTALYENMEYCDVESRGSKITSPRITTDLLEREYGLAREDKTQRLGSITVFSSEYFDPYNPHTGSFEKTGETHSVHHYAASWVSPACKYRLELRKKLAPKVGGRLSWIISSVASVIKFGKSAF